MRDTHMIRTRWAAVGAAVAITLGAVGIGGLNIASADVSSGERPVFIPIDPCRLVDTRPAAAVGPKSSPLGARDTHTVAAHGAKGECTGVSEIPTDAVGLSLNVTAVGPTENTFLTFWGDGANPGTSNLNPRAGGAPTPNSVNTPLSDTGSFNIYNDAGNVNVIVDVNGYYADHDHDDRYYTEDEADATFATQTEIDAALTVDRIIVGGYDFTPDVPGSTWSFSITWNRSAGAYECIIAPLDLPVGQTVTGVSLHHNNSTDVDVEGSLVGTVGGVGTFSPPDLVHNVAATLSTLPATPSEALVATPYALEADTTVRDDFHYTVRVCSDDDVNVATVAIDFA